MEWSNIDASLARAAARMAAASSSRQARAETARPRVHASVLKKLSVWLYENELGMPEVVRRVRALYRDRGGPAPSRAAVHEWARAVPSPSVDVASLPASARNALYNLAGTPEVPIDQVAFYCFNYGDTLAISYAAALPRAVLGRALRVPGWRPKSRALAEAVLLTRKAQDVRARTGRPRQTA